jgi:hypothetical protein
MKDSECICYLSYVTLRAKPGKVCAYLQFWQSWLRDSARQFQKIQVRLLYLQIRGGSTNRIFCMLLDNSGHYDVKMHGERREGGKVAYKDPYSLSTCC